MVITANIFGLLKNMDAMAAMIKLPKSAPLVPNGEIPPDAPTGTCLKLVIRLGFILENTPISVAHVSAFAAANEPTKMKYHISLGK